MRFIVTVERNRAREERRCHSARDGAAFLDRMFAEGYELISIIDGLHLPTTEIDLRRAALTENSWPPR